MRDVCFLSGSVLIKEAADVSPVRPSSALALKNVAFPGAFGPKTRTPPLPSTRDGEQGKRFQFFGNVEFIHHMYFLVCTFVC